MLLEGFEFIDWLRAGAAGWRYLLSGTFRRETRARWKEASTLRVTWEILCGIAGIAFIPLVVYVVISLFAGWDW
jgi:hypothetical protein